jgi:thioesterase domain-containing protein
MTDPACAALQTLYDAMPPVRALGVQVRACADDRVRLWAPLAPNLNDKDCAFGGSLTSLMMLASWGLAQYAVNQAGHAAGVYVAESSQRFRQPLFDDLRAEAWFPDPGARGAFLAELAARGRAAVAVESAVWRADGSRAASQAARYVAIAGNPA